jgi:secondary thiamine-phosphate synthase enzyme
MRKFTVTTNEKREIVDITGMVESILIESVTESEGVAHLFALHTTVALSVADLDPGTDLDMLDAFEKMVPRLDYRHPHNPAHMPDHILSAMIGPTVTLPFSGGRLVLGEWQRAILIELDGPRERTIAVSIVAAK